MIEVERGVQLVDPEGNIFPCRRDSAKGKVLAFLAVDPGLIPQCASLRITKNDHSAQKKESPLRFATFGPFFPEQQQKSIKTQLPLDC